MIEENKKMYLQLIKQNIKRPGIEELVDWISKSDFFVAPASTKFHSAVEGGLCDHSLKAYNRYLQLLEMEYGKDWQDVISLESATIIALLHDVCKINYYKVEYRNTKVDGEWVQKPVFVVDDQLPYGHGEKSVYIINGFLRLTREEAMAINWHMGGFDTRVRGGSYSLSDAFYKFPTALIFHTADVMATYLDEGQ
ncbi:MAG: hydrolase [Clostridia bacterium]|nr:hydrolase [Clostridia bacterium]